MITIATPVGNFNFDDSKKTIEEFNESGGGFVNDLSQDMNNTINELLAKNFQLPKAIFIKAEDLKEMLDGYDEEVLIFYRTEAEGQQAATFTVISADDSMTAVLSKKKWKFSSILKHPWTAAGVIVPNHPGFDHNFSVLNINNLLLRINYTHEQDEAAGFEGRLAINSADLLAKIEAGELPPLKIAAVLKNELEAFTDPLKYKGAMIFLNYAAHERVVDIVNFDSKRYVSLTLAGVVDSAGDWVLSTDKNKDNFTMSVICPPDCPTYNNNP